MLCINLLSCAAVLIGMLVGVKFTSREKQKHSDLAMKPDQSRAPTPALITEHVATRESDKRQSVVQISGSSPSVSDHTKVKGTNVGDKKDTKQGVLPQYLIFCAMFMLGMVSYMFWILKQDPIPSFSGLGTVAKALGTDAAAAVGAAVGATTDAAASAAAKVSIPLKK